METRTSLSRQPFADACRGQPGTPEVRHHRRPGSSRCGNRSSAWQGAAKLEHPGCTGSGYRVECGLRPRDSSPIGASSQSSFLDPAQPVRPAMPMVRNTFRRTLATLCALAAFLGATAVASATSRSSGRDHRFSATYNGHGQGEASGTSASGSAALRGRGRPIGRGTMSGSAQGTFTSKTCVIFSGKAVLRGTMGSIRLRARRAHACAGGGGNSVSFSGTATVTGGTDTFGGAQGRLSFTGTFDRTTGSVKVSLSGVIRYRA